MFVIHNCISAFDWIDNQFTHISYSPQLYQISAFVEQATKQIRSSIVQMYIADDRRMLFQ